jgi:hypothetical protein
LAGNCERLCGDGDAAAVMGSASRASDRCIGTSCTCAHRQRSAAPPPQPPPLLLLLLLLLLRAPSSAPQTGGAAKPDDLLQPTFEWNAGLPPDARYITPVQGSTSRNIAVEGRVSIRQWENPKQLESLRPGAKRWRWYADRLDVLALHPLYEYRRSVRQFVLEPALATVTVHLGEAEVGLNYFRLLVRTDALYAAALTPECPLVRAVLAPLNSPRRVLREVDLDLSVVTTRMGGPHGNVSVVEASHRTYPGYDDLGEWMEVKGEFWLLAKELGEEVSVLGMTKLFVTLGCEQAEEGVAAFVDMWMTNSGLENVGLDAEVHTVDVLLGIMQEHDHADHYHLVNQLVPSSLLTDGVTSGLAYAIYDQNPTKRRVDFPITLMPERSGAYICGARVTFAYAAHVTRWSLWVTESPRLAGAFWEKVVVMDEPDWPRSHWSFDDAKVYLSSAMGINDTVHTEEEDAWLDGLEGAGGVGSDQSWEDELWARQELRDNPITEAIHEFNCTHAKHVMLRLEHTVSDLFAVAELEVQGYPMEGGNDSATPCPLRCRHGGSCLSSGVSSCSCPSTEWGWAGPECRICNRTAAESHYELFNVDIEAPIQPTIFNAWRQLSVINGGSSIKVAQLKRAYDELADPVRRRAYDAARAEPCTEGEDVTPCDQAYPLEECPIVIAEKTSAAMRKASPWAAAALTFVSVLLVAMVTVQPR